MSLPATVYRLEPEMSRPERVAAGPGEVAALSHPCPDRSPNEDAAVIVPVDAERCVLAVADGLGGQPAGDRASRLALDVLAGAVAGCDPDSSSLRAAILDGIERANQEVQALGVGAGTTLAVVEIHATTARAYHVGDSEILIVGQRGKLKLQTLSHAPVAYGVHAGLIDERDAVVHEDRHLLSNLVGSPDMRIDVGPVTALSRRDRVLVGSDGLFDNLHLDEIVQIIRKGPILTAASALTDRARRRMDHPREGWPTKPDDLTFLLFALR